MPPRLMVGDGKSYLAQNATLAMMGFGWEICTTGGVDETFQVTSYTFTVK